MARLTRKDQDERETAAEELVLAGWSHAGVRDLCRRFSVRERTVREWREGARARIRARGRPGATTGANLEEALERLEILWELALQDRNIRVARAILWDRNRLLDLVPRQRVDLGGNVTIDVTSRRRVDVSVFPTHLLEAIARGVSDDELDELIAREADDDLKGLLGPVIDVAVADIAESDDDSDEDIR